MTDVYRMKKLMKIRCTISPEWVQPTAFAKALFFYNAFLWVDHLFLFTNLQQVGIGFRFHELFESTLGESTISRN